MVDEELAPAVEQVGQRARTVVGLELVVLLDPDAGERPARPAEVVARITDLAAPLPISFAAVSRHVGVLEEAGLVRRNVRGREHWLSVRPEGLRSAERWIHEQSAFWSRRADALAARLERRSARR